MAAINNLREWQSPPAMPLPTLTLTHTYDGCISVSVCECIFGSTYCKVALAVVFLSPRIPWESERKRDRSCRGSASLFALRMHFSVGNKFSKKNSKSSVNNWRHFRTQLVRFREREKGREMEGGHSLVGICVVPLKFYSRNRQCSTRGEVGW